MLKGQKILFTGAAGVAGFPIASWLATENEVWGASRLASHESRDKLTAANIRPHPIDIATGDLSSLPATVVNWCGDEVIPAQESCRAAAALLGTEAKLQTKAIPGYPDGNFSDHTKRLSITGPCKVPFREGIERGVRDVQAELASGKSK